MAPLTHGNLAAALAQSGIAVTREKMEQLSIALQQGATQATETKTSGAVLNGSFMSEASTEDNVSDKHSEESGLSGKAGRDADSSHISSPQWHLWMARLYVNSQLLMMTVNDPQMMTMDDPQMMTVNDPQMMTMNDSQMMTVDDPQMMTMNDSQMMTVNDPQMMTVNDPQMMTVDDPQMMTVNDP
eukprot:gene8295-9853_t